MFAGLGRREIHWKGEYREVVAPKRLVFPLSDRPSEVYELVVVVRSDLATAAPRCCSSSTGACRPSSTNAPGKGGRPSSTAWRDTWPTPDPAGASAYRVLDLDGTRGGQ
jgi:hypothetical protein